MTPLDAMALWRRTLAPQGDPLDALGMVWQDARTARDAGCAVGGEEATHLDRAVSPPIPPLCA